MLFDWLFGPKKKTTAKRFLIDEELFDSLDAKTKDEYYYWEREQERDELNYDAELADFYANRYDD